MNTPGGRQNNEADSAIGGRWAAMYDEPQALARLKQNSRAMREHYSQNEHRATLKVAAESAAASLTQEEHELKAFDEKLQRHLHARAEGTAQRNALLAEQILVERRERRDKRGVANKPWFEFLLRPQVAWCGAVAVIAIIIAIPLMLAPGEATFHSQAPSSRGPGVLALPRNLALNLKKKTIRLYEGKDHLSGKLVYSNSTPDEDVYAIDLRGVDENGLEGHLTGKARLVRQNGGNPSDAKMHFQAVVVEGEFKAGNEPGSTVSERFEP